jgi:membrane protein
MLLWVYYSSEIFLLGAEVTRAYSVRHGSRSDLAPIVRANLPTRGVEPSNPPLQNDTSRGVTLLVLLAVAWTSAMLTELMMPSRRR